MPTDQWSSLVDESVIGLIYQLAIITHVYNQETVH